MKKDYASNSHCYSGRKKVELLYFRGLGDFTDWRDHEINELKHRKKKGDVLGQHVNPRSWLCCGGKKCACYEKDGGAWCF